MASRRNVHHNRRRGLHAHMRDAAIIRQEYMSKSEGPRESASAQKSQKSQKARKA